MAPTETGEDTETEPFDKQLQRATKVLELIMTGVVLVIYIDMMDHGSLFYTLNWKWEQYKNRMKLERRMRAAERYIVWQAEQTLEEAQ